MHLELFRGILLERQVQEMKNIFTQMQEVLMQVIYV